MGIGNAYDLLVDGAVLLCVLAHGTTVLLLGCVKAWGLSATSVEWDDDAGRTLIKVVFLLAGSSVVGV